jgi:FADH2 O2-dependent halogenase
MVSDQLGLRDEVPRFRTDTRAIYTHMMGVRSADLLLNSRGRRNLISPLGQSTMHHVFDGGWMWVIPFNNHRDATNPLTSVGLMLDRRMHHDPQGTPDQEFRRIISGYPTITRHFAEAEAVRPWIGSGRIQYSSPHLLAPRLIQLPHAADFIDPLYSSGMSVLIAAVDLIAEALLKAVAEDDFDMDRFQVVEDVVNRGFDHYDSIVSGAYDSFASYDTWNAWNRNWVMGSLLGTFGPLSLWVRYHKDGDRSYLDKTTEVSRMGVLGSNLPGVLEVVKASRADLDAAVAGDITYTAASERIFARFRGVDFLPPYMGFGDPGKRATATFTLIPGARHVMWYKRHGNDTYRDNCTFPLLTYARDGAGFVLGEAGDAGRRGFAALRDVFFAKNNDWRHTAPSLSAHPYLATPIPAAAPVEDELTELDPAESPRSMS